MSTKARIAEIAFANAMSAIDQMGSPAYEAARGRCTSIDSHSHNVVDTLKEEGLHSASNEMDALAQYYAHVSHCLAKAARSQLTREEKHDRFLRGKFPGGGG